MSPDNHGNYVSVLASNFFQPLTSLVEELIGVSTGPNEVQASELENGFSGSVIVLSVLVIESTTQRTQYIRGEQNPLPPVDFVRYAFPNSGFADLLEEIFVVRNVIAHNHLWEAEVTYDKTAGLKLLSANRLKSYGGRSNFDRVLNSQTRQTKILRLNLFPTRICRRDAIISLKHALGFLLFLQNENHNYISISHRYVNYMGDFLLFTDFVNSLQVEE